MVNNQNTVWLGLEYFCSEGDELWQKSDQEMIEFSKNELELIEFIDRDDVIDSTVIRMKKAYPCYFGTYNRFDLIKDYLDHFLNLYLVGRSGMFKYDSTDYYVLASMQIVENIKNNIIDKESVWNVKTYGEFDPDN